MKTEPTAADTAALALRMGLPELRPESLLERARASFKTLDSVRAALVHATFDAQENLRVFKRSIVRTQQDINDSEACAIEAKKDAKRYKAERDAVLEPFKEIVKLVTGLYAPLLGSLDGAEKELKTKMVKGLAALSAEQNRALKAVSTLTSVGRIGPARQVLLKMPSPEMPKNMSTREIWKFRVKDITKVEDKYCMIVVNTTAVEEAIALGVRQIAGLEIYAEQSVTLRTK
jgi:hypothetical protein